MILPLSAKLLLVMGAAALGAAAEGEAETSETIGRAVSLLFVLGVGIFDCVLFFVGENVRDCERWVGFYMGGQSSRHPMEAASREPSLRCIFHRRGTKQDVSGGCGIDINWGDIISNPTTDPPYRHRPSCVRGSSASGDLFHHRKQRNSRGRKTSTTLNKSNGVRRSDRRMSRFARIIG